MRQSFRVSPLLARSAAEDLVYDTVQAVLRMTLRTVWRLSLADVRELPNGPVILAANHRSFIDPLVLGASVERRVTYMMTAKYYDLPRLNPFFRMARCIVVDEEADNKRALRDSLEVLQAGHVLGIFPEGHISPDGAMRKVQPGMAWLARRTGAPIFPVWLGGTREVLSKGETRLRIGRVAVRMAGPRRVSDFGEGRAAEDALTRAVVADIARLGGFMPPG